MERGFLVNKKKKIMLLITAGIICAAVLLAALAAAGKLMGDQKVSFAKVPDTKIPVDIEEDVIPEYKTLERALACCVDDDIYVIVTRGEKPTSGYGVSIAKVTLEKEDDKTNLIVYADFKDPEEETPISQIITYPMAIVKTDLKQLPDTIQMRIQY